MSGASGSDMAVITTGLSQFCQRNIDGSPSSEIRQHHRRYRITEESRGNSDTQSRGGFIWLCQNKGLAFCTAIA